MTGADMRKEFKAKRRNRRTSGFSLIEVLVALVILVIGIFSILRLFPGGFLTILRTSDQTQALGLVQQNLDTEKQALAVPDSIVALDPTDQTKILTEIVPDDLSDNSFASAAGNTNRYTDPYYVSNANHFDRVLAETFKIPASDKVRSEYLAQVGANVQSGSAHILNYGPVFNEFGTDSSGAPTDSLVVRGTPLQRIEMTRTGGGLNTADPSLAIASETQYVIDYANHLIAFKPRVGTLSRKFVFAYSYWKNNGGVYEETAVFPSATVPKDTTIIVPDVALVGGQIPPPVWMDIFDATNGINTPAGFDPARGFKLNSEEVSRKFKLISGAPFTDATPPANYVFDANDPYEYAWNSPQYGLNANVGALVFNPNAVSVANATSTGVQGLVARVDYTIYDSHIIHEDRQIPAAAPYDIRLSLQNILINGHIGDNSSIYDSMTVYNGLFRSVAATPDVVIYNLTNGVEIANTSSGILTLEDRPGIVHLDQKTIETAGEQNVRVRIYYRTEKEHATQILKANNVYVPVTSPGAIQYNSYFVGGSFTGPGLTTRIYFPLCEAGKTVTLSEYFVFDSGTIKRYTNEAFRINADPGLFESFGGKNYSWIDFTSKHTGSRFDATSTGRAIGDIRGSSIRSRVIWREATRWRKADTELLLTQPSLR